MKDLQNKGPEMTGAPEGENRGRSRRKPEKRGKIDNGRTQPGVSSGAGGQTGGDGPAAQKPGGPESGLPLAGTPAR